MLRIGNPRASERAGAGGVGAAGASGDGLAPSEPGAPVAASDAAGGTARWNWFTRVVFRFLFVYLLLYNLPSLLGRTLGLTGHPRVYQAMNWWENGKHALGVSVGEQVFGVKIEVFPNGSGDTTYNYVEVFMYACVAAVLTLLWTIVDGRRPHYRRMHGFLRGVVRFALAFSMIGYGLAKIIKTQFPFPEEYRLSQTYGESSPMGLLWAFMGQSQGYNVFAGLGEAVGGVLVAFRRTTLLGSLVLVGVMANVVMLNFCYDVPVKLYSSHLLLMAVFLVAPEFGRLMNLLVWDRPVGPSPIGPALKNRWLNGGWIGIKALLIGYMLWITGEAQNGALATRAAEASEWSGLYRVTAFQGEEPAPGVQAGGNWRDVIVRPPPNKQAAGTMQIRDVEGAMRSHRYKVDEKESVFRLMPPVTGQSAYLLAQAPVSMLDLVTSTPLKFTQGAPGELSVSGIVDGRAITATLKKVPLESYPLVKRGFHWINEYPFNR